MAEKQHCVRVGSLACDVTEEVLYNLFSKFGEVKSVFIVPDERGDSERFGYVSFTDAEFAQCAATVMHGSVLNGHAIRVKRPEEVKRTKSESVASNNDQRMLTDCEFYMQKRECTCDMSKCPFRHCEKAQLSTNVCTKWLQRKCENLECENKHPSLTKTEELINNNSPIRCPSHNAFKCYGECGNSKCETHFMEKLAYVEHVRLMKEKVANPVSHCDKCQAVFFKNSEKLAHVCHVDNRQQFINLQHFSPTWLPAEKDIAQPVPLHVWQSQSETTLRQTPKTTCVSPKTTHTQVLSSSPCDQMDTVCGKLQCANTSKKNPEPVGVFWDFENCPIPKGKSALAVVQKLRSVFFKEKREVEFMCVCDISKEKKAVIEELNKAQVTVVHINSTSKNAADDKLRQSLRRFAQTYCRPATVILISGDGNFTVELSDLRHRHNFQIICLHNEAASNALLASAHECHRFDLIMENLDAFLPSQMNTDIAKGTVDVLITNLPSVKSNVLKSRLTKLSDNCGGKVLTIHDKMAIIRFPNSEAAFRARRRLDKEELFGCILQASLLPSSFTQPTNKSTIREEQSTQNIKKMKPTTTMKAAYVTPMVNTTIKNQTKPTHLKTPMQLKTPAQLTNTMQQEAPSPRGLTDASFCHSPNYGDPKKVQIINDIPVRKNGTMLGNQQPSPNHIPKVYSNKPTTTTNSAPVRNNGTISNHTLPGNEQPSPNLVSNVQNMAVRANGGITSKSVVSAHQPLSPNIRNLNKQNQLHAFASTKNLTTDTICNHLVSGSHQNISNFQTTTTTKNIPAQHSGQICDHTLSGGLQSSPDHVIHFQNLNKQIQVYHQNNNNTMLMPYSPNVLHFPPHVHPHIHSAILSPMVNHSLQRRSPSPDQPRGGVDLLVTNLNECLPRDEVKKKFACVFREHCKVYNVLLHARPGAALRAFIKVPKMFDAHVAISKLSGRAIQGKVIHVSIASDNDKQLCYLQEEVTEILQEAPLNWLPLTTFMDSYEKKYRKHFDLLTLSQVKDCVVVDGSPGCQTLSLRGNKAGSELVKQDPLSFPSDVYKLLNHYDGVIALASFPALYWLEYHKELQLSASGRTLVEILNDIPNVIVKSKAEMSVVNKTVAWIKPMTKPCDVSYFVQFTSRLLQVFQQDHKFEVTIEDFKAKYLSLFEQELDHLNYGFCCVENLFEAFPKIIKLEKGNQIISLTQEQRLSVFKQEITELLSQFEDNFALFSTFAALYTKYFGHEFKSSSFGFNRFNDLIKAIPETAQVIGHAQLKAVKLIKEPDTTVPSVCSTEELANRLAVMIKGRKSREIPVARLNKLYYRNYGHHLRVENYECDKLTQLIQRLLTVQVVKRNGEEFLQLCTKNVVEIVQKELVALLNKADGKFLFVKDVIPSYEATYKRSFLDTGLVALSDILQTNDHFQVLGNGNEQIIKTPDEENDVNVLMDTVAVEILCDCPEYSSPKHTFLALYQDKLLKRYGRFLENTKEDTTSLPSCITTFCQNDEEWVELKVEYRQRILIERLKELFSVSTEPVLLSQLFQNYTECYKTSFTFSHFGLTNMTDLKTLLRGVFEMTFSDVGNCGEASISLSKLTRLDKECQAILKNSDGCLFLCRFSSTYQQMFGNALVVADFGYTKLGSLLNAVCQTCKIIGNGSEKLVITANTGIYGRICKGRNDFLSVRILQEEKNSKDGNKEEAVCSVDLISETAKTSSTSQNTVKSCDTGSPSRDGNVVTMPTSPRHMTPAINTVEEMVSTTRYRPSSQKVRLAANFQTPLHTNT